MAADSWSTTTSEVYRQIEQALAATSQFAVATIVDVEGTAYRRPGAKMVIESDGTSHGGITAGCLYEPLQEAANEVLESGSSTVVTYDLTSDDTWGLGLGCNGVIDVLIEPTDDSWQQMVDARTNRKACSLVTAIESNDPSIPVGARAVISEQGSGTNDRRIRERTVLPDSVIADIETEARTYATEGSTDCISVSTETGEIVLVIDGIEPSQKLVVFGGQPDVRPVVRFAAQVGLEVTVVTGRGGRADDEMFPAADRVLATHPTNLSNAGIDERTFVLIMSHNFVDDRLALEAALGTEAPYIGLMGPRKRFEQLQSDLENEGVELSKRDRERIATPVGLNLGSDAPVEIALSVVSEIIAVSNDRNGGRLVDQAGPIHDRKSVMSQ
ncbi:xanthine and Co dehydrogenase maturation factor [Natronococcus amylolyticus DSM 10524]|uniref:Xanthine and Co dehydrogenase maturation factor n=1 Tax=Natronococcus amylolyticus DSM 10524 TaxID=1227497 RepID=L9X3F2_9EURY|nr:XdhC/CoxI family protein [Natronococcus amylolyticus]ELY56304.1 xanthine and Co dehydrogenase maturation factor [Natronococcus amylolyticus DSM 10524]